MCADRQTETIEIVTHEPMVVLVWGDSTLTTVPDDRRFGPAVSGLHTSALLKRLMAVRLRFLADELDPPPADE